MSQRLLEDGTSLRKLEDGTSIRLLEDGATGAAGQPTWKRWGGVQGMGGRRISDGARIWAPQIE